METPGPREWTRPKCFGPKDWRILESSLCPQSTGAVQEPGAYASPFNWRESEELCQTFPQALARFNAFEAFEAKDSSMRRNLQ